MNKKPLFTFILPLLLGACGGNSSSNPPVSSAEPASSEPISTSEAPSSEPSSEAVSSQQGYDMAPVDQELLGCYNYFTATTNYIEGSAGYGLTQDRESLKTLSSIAATGFLLASYPVFVEQGYMTKADAEEKSSKTLDTVLRLQANPETSYAGCIAHFVNKNTAQRSSGSEISTIDTAILVSGALVAGEYFQGEVKEKAEEAWSNLDYTAFHTTKNGKSCISMGVDDPEKKNQLAAWDYYAEQLMIYILGAGNPNPAHRVTSKYYKNMARVRGEYAGIQHIQSWYGSTFTYQFSQAFYNFKEYNDYKGNNFFENSVRASATAYAFSKDLAAEYKSFDSPAWGLSACDSPTGYSGLLGCAPRGFDGYNDENYRLIQGTVAPYSAIGCLPFLPKESYDALVYYQALEALNHPTYGLRDSYCLDFRGYDWYDMDFIGIDKGIEVLQLYNFKNPDFVCNLTMQNEHVIEGFLNNEFVSINNE